MSFLLDTNVVSELRKVRAGKADPQVAAWARAVPGVSLFLPVVIVQELETGALQLERRDPAQGALLRRWLDGHVPAGLRRPAAAARRDGRARSAALHVPNPRPYRDALIAATALVHGMTLVTRNVADFGTTGVPLLNPWDAGSPP